VKSNYKLLVAVLTGLLVGAVGNSAIHAQQVKMRPVYYIISEADAVTDTTAIRSYGARVPETLAPFNGHYQFVAGRNIESLDGGAPPEGIVLLLFDSAEQAHAWYNSPAYQAIKPIRLAAVKGRMFIVEGAVPH
jgi:uncharacterized protein (DUF1330 family)